MVEQIELENASHLLSKQDAKLQDVSFALSDASTEVNQDDTAQFGDGKDSENT